MLRTRVRHAVVFCALLASVAACSSSTEPEGEGSLTGTWRGSVAGTKDGAGFTGSVTIRLTENAATGQTTGTAELSGLSGLFGEDATPNIQALAAPFRPGEVVMDLCNGGCDPSAITRIAHFRGEWDGPDRLRGDIFFFFGNTEAEGFPLTLTRQ